MRLNIHIDDELMENAMRAGDFANKRQAVEEALRLFVRRKTYDGLLALRGKLHWAGDDSVDWTKIPADEPSPALAQMQETTSVKHPQSEPDVPVHHRCTKKHENNG